MKSILPCALAITPAFAQTAVQYDFNGDPLRPTSGPGVDVPGQVLNTLTHAGGGTDGVALFSTGNLLWADSDGMAAVFEIDLSGAQVGSYPVEEDNDAWLGYDASRDLIITSNAASDLIKGFTPGSGTPVFSIPSPVPGPVGVAWDAMRDEYVVCDWDTDVVVVIDAVTLSVARTLPTSLTRMAGVAYDCVDDTYVIGDRDTNTHYVMDPLTGAVITSYLTAGIGTASNPRGAALSTQSGIWTGDWGNADMYEQEANHPTQPNPCGASGGVGTPYCNPAAANSTGSPASIMATGSRLAANNDLTLIATELPLNSFGFFITSRSQGFVANPNGSDGNLCLGGAIGRYVGPGQIQSSGSTGTFALPLDLTMTPTPTGFVTVLPSDTWNFQAWHRDSGPSGPTSNFTNGLSVDFL